MAETTPLVLLPGLLNDARLWRDQIDGLGEVAAPQVADLTRRDSMAGLAAEVLDAAPARFALAGLSMGGYVAFEILRQAPERVSRLALLDTRPDPDPPEGVERRKALIEEAEAGGFDAIPDKLLPALVAEASRADPAIVEAVRAMAHRVGKDAFVRQQTAIMNRPDSRPLLDEIAVPTLVLCGREDQLSPVETHAEMARRIPGARSVVVEEAGHLSPLERPDPVTRALRGWLAGDDD